MKIFYFLISITSYIVPSFCGEHPDGESQVSRSQDVLGNYHFSYKVANHEGEQFREEGTDAQGRVIGSYGLKHVDGTHRVVDYVADKDGFRASVRSNEQGLVNAGVADTSIPLSVAATSDDVSRQQFGRRIDDVASKVEYVSKDEEAKESRQRNFDDYRPLNPVAYYPSDSRSSLIPTSVDQPRSPRKISPPDSSEEDSKPVNVYFPPIDPHTAVRPPYYTPRERSSDNFFPTTTSRKPYIPPYGGFDDDEDEPVLPIEKRPSAGFRPDQDVPSPFVPLNTARRIPPPDRRSYPPIENRNFPPIEHRNFDLPRFPPSSLEPRPLISNYPTRDPPLFDPPSYDGRIGGQNVVLRAVPIPNGIQAVRVDPTTGRIVERLVYPLFLRDDGKPEYDRNILLHNDDITDDGNLRYDDPSYLDMPYPRGPFRGVRNQPPYDEDGRRYINKFNNRSKIDVKKLSEPSSADIAWIKKQLDLVEGFEKNPFRDRFLPKHERSFFDHDHFEDENQEQYDRRVPSSSRSRPDLSSYSIRDDLASEGSKQTSAKLQEKDGTISEGDDKKVSEEKDV